jgi:hypothetical protein
MGGGTLFCSMLANILRSQIYIGRIQNKKENASYKGQHQPIIDKELFDRVQSLMDENRNKENETYKKDAYLLSGKIFDPDGNPFKNQKSSKNGNRKYRYYAMKKKYLPAGDLDDLAMETVRKLLDSPLR